MCRLQPADWDAPCCPCLPAEEEARKVAMSPAEREQVSLLRRHAHAAGSLAQAVADAASPLAMSQSLQVGRAMHATLFEGLPPNQQPSLPPAAATAPAATLRCKSTSSRPSPRHAAQVAVQSFGVVAEALHALAAVTEAVELDVNGVRGRQGGWGWGRGGAGLRQGPTIEGWAVAAVRAVPGSTRQPSTHPPWRRDPLWPMTADAATGAAARRRGGARPRHPAHAA